MPASPSPPPPSYCFLHITHLARAMLTLPPRRQPSTGAEASETSIPSIPPLTAPAAQASVDASVGGEGGGGGSEVATISPAGSNRVGGVAIATCCHHVCNWRDYTGKDYLRRLVSLTDINIYIYIFNEFKYYTSFVGPTS